MYLHFTARKFIQYFRNNDQFLTRYIRIYVQNVMWFPAVMVIVLILNFIIAENILVFFIEKPTNLCGLKMVHWLTFPT